MERAHLLLLLLLCADSSGAKVHPYYNPLYLQRSGSSSDVSDSAQASLSSRTTSVSVVMLSASGDQEQRTAAVYCRGAHAAATN
eukprot:4946-Heterococcus_DN1.PRE.1